MKESNTYKAYATQSPSKPAKDLRNHKNLIYKLTRGIVRVYAKLMFQVDIESHEKLPDGAKIFVANHPSLTDPFLLHLHSPMSVLITDKAFAIPLFGSLLRHVGQISAAKGSGSLDKAIKLLADGQSVGLFPEGANSPQNGRLAEPRSGAARLALISGAPVIPIGIHLRHDRFFRSLAVMTRKRDIGWVYMWGPYVITIGKPMYFSGDVEDRELVGQISQIIMQQIKLLILQSEERLTIKLKPARSNP